MTHIITKDGKIRSNFESRRAENEELNNQRERPICDQSFEDMDEWYSEWADETTIEIGATSVKDGAVGGRRGSKDGQELSTAAGNMDTTEKNSMMQTNGQDKHFLWKERKHDTWQNPQKPISHEKIEV